MSDRVNVTALLPAQLEQIGKCSVLITADRSLECVSEKTKGSGGCGTEAQIDENTLTHTQHSQKHIDNDYSVVWGHAWQSLNNFNEPYLVRIGKRSPHRAAFIKQTSPRQIFKTDSLTVFRGAPRCTSKSIIRQHQKCKEKVLDPCTHAHTHVFLWLSG